MAGFLYYAAGGAPVNLERAKALGLGYAFEGRCGYAGVTRGPDDQAGYVFADSDLVPSHRRKYLPAEQQWRRIPGGEVWVGLWKSERPGPGELRRDDALRGHLVKLADDRLWLIPIARAALESDGEQLQWYQALPTVSTLSDDGRWRPGAIHQRYAPLWAVAERFASAIALAGSEGDDDGRYVLQFDNLHAAAALALGANYRIGPAEIDLLGLLTEQHALGVLKALIDWPTLAAWLAKKKRTGDGSSTSGGGGD